MDDINIGQKILEQRKAKGLNIRELAKLANITPSLLSQIERSLANPSINTLKYISKALGIPLFTFFVSDLNTQNLVVRADKRKRLIFPESEDTTFELLSPDTNGAIEFLLMKLAPNSCSSEELMDHEGEEVDFVMEGKIDLYLGDELITLNTGDSVKIPPFTKHKWHNPYDSCSKLVFAITPPTF